MKQTIKERLYKTERLVIKHWRTFAGVALAAVGVTAMIFSWKPIARSIQRRRGS